MGSRWFSVLLVLVGVPAGVSAEGPVAPPRGAESGWICFEPGRAGTACPKGAMTGDAALDACEAHQRKEKARPWRFRVGQGAWQEVAPKRWRCVPVPLERRVRVVLEDEADKVSVPRGCASRRVDVTFGSFYGGIQAHCSRRKGADDELLSDYALEKRP